MARDAPREKRRGVVLSQAFDILAHFGEGMRHHRPHLELLTPEQVTDPRAIEFALVFDPADDAFAPYPNLALICSVSVAAHQLLACPSLPAGVPITRVCSDAQGQTMAGFVAWHVLWHQRRFADYLHQQRRHRWRNLAYRPPQRVGVTLLGYGQMGRAVARALLPMGYRVTAVTRSAPATPSADGVALLGGPAGLEAALPRSDVLINLLPLTVETHGLLAAPLFARLPEGAVLIQLGRGEQLIEADLLAALDSGRLAGASLDVFATEPLPPEHPFWTHSGVLVTPHDACRPSPEAVAEHLEASLASLARGLAPTPRVDPERGY